MDCRDLQFHFARPRDAQALALMARDLIETGLGWTYQPRRISELIHDPETVTLVARDAGQLVGFAVMTFGDERAHLILLAVRRTHQRRGIARRLLNWLLESATVAGVASVHVELRASNRPAYLFYRMMGFAETVHVPGYYRGRESAVRMLRMLRPPGLTTATWQPPVGPR